MRSTASRLGSTAFSGGTLVANDKADLTDGILKAPISLTHYSSEASALVWTGTNLDGTGTGTNCSDWTVDTSSQQCDAEDPEYADAGSSTQFTPQWTDVGTPRQCSGSACLCCFGSGQ